jgi:hypothetical protein
MTRQDVAQGVGHNLDTTRAANTVIPPAKSFSDLLLASYTETLRNETTDGITTAEGPNSSATLIESNGNTTSKKPLEEGGSTTTSEKVDSANEGIAKG